MKPLPATPATPVGTDSTPSLTTPAQLGTRWNASLPASLRGPDYWRSLDELADTPEFRQWVEREFPAGASELTDPVSRRHFVKIMSASFLLAGLGLTGCRRPVEKIQPFSKLPENYVHGVPQFYATARPIRDSAVPLVVKSNDGRPTKIEGNPLHPDSNGATDLFTQASILDLYDPDRAQRFLRTGKAVTREAMLDALDDVAMAFSGTYQGLGARVDGGATKAGGQGLCFLLERSSSPSRDRVVALVREKLPKAKWFIHEPVEFDVHRQAATLAFGKPLRPSFRYDAAKVIVSLDGDFLGAEPDAHVNIRRFAKSRKLTQPSDAMSRLYAAEALFTLTGANADHRLRLPASQILPLALQLAAKVTGESWGAGVPPLGGTNPGWLEECAKDLLANKGAALVVAGHRQPLAVHLLAHAMNVALGALGKTLTFHSAPEPTEGSLADLARALEAAAVDTLVILGGNPVYTAAADLEWPRALRKARSVIRLGAYEDETASLCDLHLPMAHYLESWGDARTADGTLVPIQPLIEPLFGGLTELEVLARLGGLATTGSFDLVRATFRSLGGESEDAWKRFLHDGCLPKSAQAVVEVEFQRDDVAKVVSETPVVPAPSADALEVVIHRDAKVDDGRHNNNGWLQELPDPVTKLTWENVILLSPATAKHFNLDIRDRENNDLQVPLVKIEVGGRSVIGPAWIQPGMADHVVALALGYGREKSGRVGSKAGYDAYRVRTSANPHLLTAAKLTATGARHKLATTQNHWAMEGRPVVREATLVEYRDQPRFVQAMNLPEPEAAKDANGQARPLYPNPLDVSDANGVTPRDRAHHQWGMSVDLNACVGCSACVVACQSENNIPIVGKDQVRRNREMHWLRLDRYYAGDPADPEAVTQPMFCLHCESAPCESVCPVNATVHDEEGLNLMAYNRCVGTRYCSNNCPFKVRRFNFFDYNRRPLSELVGPVYSTPLTSSTDGEWDLIRWFKNPDKGKRPEEEWELLKLVKNPDVTVRMRGVMEKCTYCVQRIEQAKIARKVKAGASGDVEVPDGAVKTACQQVCPAEAITFGNLKDPQSAVSRQKALDRNYTVLEFLNVKPRTTYLARVRNPNPALPGGKGPTQLSQEYLKKNPPLHESHAPAVHGEPGHATPEGKGGH
jgi:MoCo/4Fe-4S cofactor protein with predicted Tat translocation signal